MLTAGSVASYFLLLPDEDAGDSISNMKLQKLCYYAQGFWLALHGEPLFDDPIEAWQHGPVIPDLWREYRQHGAFGIPRPADVEPTEYDDEVRGVLEEIFEVYGQFSAWKLRNLTHDEAPWVEAWRSDDKTIGHDALRTYFATLVEHPAG